MTIGERIKHLRTERNLSQSELAELVGYSDRTTIAKIESGQRELRQSKIIDFAKALGVDPMYILGIGEKEISAPMDEKSALINQIIAKFAKLTPANQQIVLDLIDTMLNNQK